MLTPHFGAGAEINWRAGQGDYAGVNYRPIFYDFNGIWQPIKTKRFVPEIQAGIGGVAVHFNANTNVVRSVRRMLDGQSRLGELQTISRCTLR